MEATLNKFKEGARADKNMSPFTERCPQQVKRNLHGLRIFGGHSESRLSAPLKN
jgi:hypothetical protein